MAMPLTQQINTAHMHLKNIGNELMNEISLELMDLAGVLSDCEELPEANITIGCMASITYRLCDVFKFTATLGYEAITATKLPPTSASRIGSAVPLNEELATYQAQLGHIADQLEALYNSHLTFLPCDLEVLIGHPEITQSQELSEIIKGIQVQLGEVNERLDEISTFARQISQLENLEDEPAFPANKDRDWKAMTAMLTQCVATVIQRGSAEEPRWIDQPISHPKPGDAGQTITIDHPTKPGSMVAWHDARKIAIFVPSGKAPQAINKVATAAWTDHPRTTDGWNSLDLLMPSLKEPPIPKSSLPVASGVVTVEPDGRAWMISPSNKFGGYETTFPKGKRDDKNLSLQANAVKEAYEESGLKVRITGYLGDFKRTTSITRLYLAERVGGNPTGMGWESQAVKLVPPTEWARLLRNPSDKPVLVALQQLFDQ
jgi:ADP-ribose pyrophosphatase YjhB (NUDIX family)